jgi:hypothetical protein
MKTSLRYGLVVLLLLVSISSFSQEQHEIKTVFGKSGLKASGGYGAISNKFTTINGEFTDLVEIYGGWYINHRVLVGVGVAVITNNLPVPLEYRAVPGVRTSYEYGQCGLMTEYVLASDKAVHLAFQLFAGGGFTLQTERHRYDNHDWDSEDDYTHDENWFFVAEPGVQVEVNVFRWMRFCPGISYRAAFGSKSAGLTDSDISGMSANVTFKFGKF